MFRSLELRNSYGLVRVLGAFLVAASIAGAGTFSFAGSFTNDNDVQFFTFTLLNPGTVTLETFGFGGGVNGASQVITAGGFIPELQIFDAVTGNAETGTLNRSCPPGNVDPARLNTCFDLFGQFALAAGNYLLALTQHDNVANGTNLSDGFFYVDTIPDPNYNNGFFDLAAGQGTPNWAVDVVSADSASQAGTTPEPASCFAVAVPLLFLAVRSARRKV